MLYGIIVFVGFIFVCAGLNWLTQKLTKNMNDDYRYMLSEREGRDKKQSIENKVNTTIVGNDFVDSMVSVSMMDTSEDNK